MVFAYFILVILCSHGSEYLFEIVLVPLDDQIKHTGMVAGIVVEFHFSVPSVCRAAFCSLIGMLSVTVVGLC